MTYRRCILRLRARAGGIMGAMTLRRPEIIIPISPIYPMRPISRPHAPDTVAALDRPRRHHPPAALDAKSAEVLENLKALLQ